MGGNQKRRGGRPEKAKPEPEAPRRSAAKQRRIDRQDAQEQANRARGPLEEKPWEIARARRRLARGAAR